jgi:hypothetical protein
MKIVFTIIAKGMFMLWLILLFPLQIICQIRPEALAWKFSSGEIYSTESSPIQYNYMIMVGKNDNPEPIGGIEIRKK